MQKFWKISDSKSNKLIFIKDKNIYKGNPKQDELNKLNSESKNLTFLKKFLTYLILILRKLKIRKDRIKSKYFTETILKMN